MSFREWMERNNVSIKSSKKHSAAIYGAIPRMGLGHVPEGEGIEAFEDFLLRVRADESFRLDVRKRVEHRLSVKAHLFFIQGGATICRPVDQKSRRLTEPSSHCFCFEARQQPL